MLVEIPVADAVDKLTILKVKADRVTDAAKRTNVLRELNYLLELLPDVVSAIPNEMERLALVNRQLWEIEDQLRRLEQLRRFDDEFVELARLVYITNDERSAIKRAINLKCGSRFVEEKEHVFYLTKDFEQHHRSGLIIIEQAICSQNGEDGVIKSIFAAVGTTNRYYVEFGCGDGTECNTAHLASNGWSGLLMDDESEREREPRIHRERVTAENINQLLDKYKVPGTFDLLSIDIDGNDYWVWKAIDRKPRLVVIEYNAHIPPNQSLVIEYDPHFLWNGSDYFGASLLAIVELAHAKGYTLLHCEQTGANAFFLRDDLLPHGFEPVAIETLYRPPNYLNQGLRWSPDPDRAMIAPVSSRKFT